jgi:hypothetical protein
MLPDFKKTKLLIANKTTEFLESRTNYHMGGFGSIGRRPIHEGSGFVTEYEDGMIDDSSLQLLHSKVDIDTQEILKNPFIVFEHLEQIARDQAFQQSKMIVEKVSDVTEKIGNVTDFRGSLTVDKILESLDKVTIDFTPEGKPMLPSIFAGKEMIDSIKLVFDQIHSTPELLKRLDDIMANQKQRWYDRAANRKLVD